MDWLKNGFAAIRKTDDDGHEWMDIATISYDREDTIRRAEANNKACGPMWEQANRVVRIANVHVSE